MSAGNFGGDRYVSFTLSGLVDIPSAIICYFLINRYVDSWVTSRGQGGGHQIELFFPHDDNVLLLYVVRVESGHMGGC